MIEQAAARLEELAQFHRRREEADAADSADRLAFDDTVEAERLHRYQSARERTLFRTLDTLLKIRRAGETPAGAAGATAADRDSLQEQARLSFERLWDPPAALSPAGADPGVEETSAPRDDRDGPPIHPGSTSDAAVLPPVLPAGPVPGGSSQPEAARHHEKEKAPNEPNAAPDRDRAPQEPTAAPGRGNPPNPATSGRTSHPHTPHQPRSLHQRVVNRRGSTKLDQGSGAVRADPTCVRALHATAVAPDRRAGRLFLRSPRE
jgi:hypothetical protein